MKKTVKKSFALLLSLILIVTMFFSYGLNLSAATNTVAGASIEWNFNESTGTLTLTGTGATYDFRATTIGSVTKQAPWQSVKDKITTVIVGEGITTIGDYSFYNCTALTSVSLPSTLTAINGSGTMTTSYGAFQNCTALTSITLPSGLQKIGNCAFKDCTALKSITFPDSLTTLSYGAFCNCTALSTVTFGNGLTSTGSNTFYQAGVRKINWSDSITEVGIWSFYGSYLTSVELPETIESIGTRSFANSYFLTSVTVLNANATFGISEGDPFDNVGTNDSIKTTTFYGHSGSTTQKFVESKDDKSYVFVSIDDCDHEETYDYISVPATCTEAGTLQHICSNCKRVVSEEEIEALAHNYTEDINDQTTVDGHIYTHKTCTRCGDETDVVEHQKASDDSDTTYIWIGDNYTYTNTATCEKAGYERYVCNVDGCKQTENHLLASGGHTVENWNVTTQATCTTEGSRTGVCSVCKQTVTETVSPTGHTLPEEAYNVENLTETDGHIHSYFKCTVCGEDVESLEHVEWVEGYYEANVISQAHCVVDGAEIDTCKLCGQRQTVTLPANGEHDWYETSRTEPTCTAVGKVYYACRNCTMTKSENIEALGHDYQLNESSSKSATCTTAGYNTYDCSRCSVSKQETVSALGHTPQDGTYRELVAPTCEDEGSATAKCDVCKETYDITLDALGHDYVDVSKSISTKPGHSYVTPTCSRCRSTLSSEIVHDEWIDGYYTTEETISAGCLVQGRTTYTCTVCDTTKTENTPALGHKYVATGTVTTNAIFYRCEYCNLTTTQKPADVFAMWDNTFLFAQINRTATDNSSYLDVNSDGCINAKDYALMKNLAKTAEQSQSETGTEESTLSEEQ